MGENAQPTSTNSTSSASLSDVDYSVLVATLLTVVLATGSAFIWRSKLGFHLVSNANDDADKSTQAVVSSMENQPSSSGEAAAAKEGKHHRAKERRKRGKDLMKELMKAERKGKSVLSEKSSHAQEAEKEQEQGQAEDIAASTATNGNHAKRERPRSTSSRSASSSVSARSESDRHEDPDAAPSLHRPQSPSPPKRAVFPPETASVFSPEDHLAPSDTFSHASSSSSSSHITRTTGTGTGSESSMTTAESSTSANLIPDHHSSHVHSSHFLMPTAHYPAAPFQDHKNRLSGPRGQGQGHSRMSGSWEFDSTYPSNSNGSGTYPLSNGDPTSSHTVYKKPPRFRSKSRQSGSDHAIPGVQPFALPFLAPPQSGNGYYDHDAAGSPPLRNVVPNASADPTFASLNPNTVVSPSDEDDTPTQASENSQLASLKAAIDASRSREEAAKKEAETYRKEVERLRWEETGWRQREAEMQAQVYYLSQQLQLATGYNPQMQMIGQQPPQASPSISTTHLHVPPGSSQPRSPSQSFRAGSPQAFRASPSPSPQPPHPHLPPHLSIHPLQMMSPTQGSPNLSPYPGPHSYPQSPAGFFYPHPQAMSPGSAHTPGPSPLFSMLFPHAPAHLQSPHLQSPHLQSHLQSPNGMHYPGVASSSGSTSPTPSPADLSTLGMGSPIRGRLGAGAGAGVKKKRSTGETIKPKDGGGGAGMATGEEFTDSPMGDDGGGYFLGPGGDHATQGAGHFGQTGDYEEDGEEEINEVLAGAILNRPDSIRLRSRSSRNGPEFSSSRQVQEIFASGNGGAHESGGNEGGVYGDGEDAVVTFPSISNAMPLYVPPPPRVKSPREDKETTSNGNAAKESPLEEGRPTANEHTVHEEQH